MRNLFLLLGCLASPLYAAISVNDRRALVLIRDFDATDAALIAAHTEYIAAQPQSFAFLARGSSDFEM